MEKSDIAIARQIFQNKVCFFSLFGEVFLVKRKKKVFMKNLRQQYYNYVLMMEEKHLVV
jgi:hypothetical protein